VAHLSQDDIYSKESDKKNNMKAIPKKYFRLLFMISALFVLSLFYFFNRTPTPLFQGYVEGENLYVASSLEGRLVKRNVERGQRVKKGELLFQIDPKPESIAMRQLAEEKKEAEYVKIDLEKPRRPLEIQVLQDQVDIADANLILANIRLKRYNELYTKQATDLDHLDEARSRVKELEASKAQAVANLKLGQMGARIDQIQAQDTRVSQAHFATEIGAWKLSQKTLRAPVDGLVFDTYYQEGEFVAAGHPVLSLLSTQNIRIEFFVPARILPQLHLNQIVYFNCEGCQAENQAVIHYISPEAEYIPPLVYSRENSDKIVFRVKAKISEPLQFKPGQPVEIMRFGDE
jgi:HlyD family secretion protein